MATVEQLNNLRTELENRQEGLEDDMELRNDKLEDEITRLRQALQINMPHHEEEDNMDIIIDSHMRDITNENRPQMSSAGLEINNKHFKDLSNHELHKIKKNHEKDHKKIKRTILDENLGTIMDKCINFLTHSFNGYSKAFYKAEIMENIYDHRMGFNFSFISFSASVKSGLFGLIFFIISSCIAPLLYISEYGMEVKLTIL